MAAPAALIVGWARSAVVPHGGAFAQLAPHEIAAPVVQALLSRTGVRPEVVDAVVLGNALGAGGNPARMVALAAGLPEHCATYSVDTQCCAGLDAVTLGVGLLMSGQAAMVLVGGVEAWSRAPIRQHRPRHPGEAVVTYERPAFSPDPQRDPDMLVSAARYAIQAGWTRAQQDAYVVRSHTLARAHEADLAAEIVPVAGVTHDLGPRDWSIARVGRMQAAVKGRELGDDWAQRLNNGPDCSVGPLGISGKADGAAFVLLGTQDACQRLGLKPRATWVASASTGIAPETPLLAAEAAARVAILRAGLPNAQSLAAVELHDAFAVQGLSFAQALSLDQQRLNRRGGGLARGHPIGASAAVALVRLLSDLALDGEPGDLGMTAVAGAGGIGAAAIVRRS